MLRNIAAFQCGWFACVLGAAHGWPWAGVLAAAALVALHLGSSLRPSREALLIAIAAATGLLVDSVLSASHLLAFASPGAAAPLAPGWIVAMWALFATTLNVSMRWLRRRWLLGGALGALAGPLSYLAGARLGALELVRPVPALAALAIEWGLLVPALVESARRIDETGRQTR